MLCGNTTCRLEQVGTADRDLVTVDDPACPETWKSLEPLDRWQGA